MYHTALFCRRKRIAKDRCHYGTVGHFCLLNDVDDPFMQERLDGCAVEQVLVTICSFPVYVYDIVRLIETAPQLPISGYEQALHLPIISRREYLAYFGRSYLRLPVSLIVSQCLLPGTLEKCLNDTPRLLAYHLGFEPIRIARHSHCKQVRVAIDLSVDRLEVFHADQYQRLLFRVQQVVQPPVDLLAVTLQVVFRIIDANPLPMKDSWMPTSPPYSAF